MSKKGKKSVRNLIFENRIQLFLFSLFLFSCADLKMNNPCDPLSKDYTTGLFVKIATNDKNAYCEANRMNEATPVLPCNPCRIFITAVPYSGGLGGISGADNKCAIDTNKPNSGIYKAFLSDTIARRACLTANCGGGVSEHLDWVMKPNSSYVRSIGAVTIGTIDSNGLLTTQTNSVTISSVTTWLGFNANWTTEPGLHCDNWIDGSNSFVGTLNDQSTNPMIGAATNLCNNSHSLLCVEQ